MADHSLAEHCNLHCHNMLSVVPCLSVVCVLLKTWRCRCVTMFVHRWVVLGWVMIVQMSVGWVGFTEWWLGWVGYGPTTMSARTSLE